MHVDIIASSCTVDEWPPLFHLVVEKVIVVKYAPYVTFHETFDTLAKGMFNRIFLYIFFSTCTHELYISFVCNGPGSFTFHRRDFSTFSVYGRVIKPRVYLFS